MPELRNKSGRLFCTNSKICLDDQKRRTLTKCKQKRFLIYSFRNIYLHQNYKHRTGWYFSIVSEDNKENIIYSFNFTIDTSESLILTLSWKWREGFILKRNMRLQNSPFSLQLLHDFSQAHTLETNNALFDAGLLFGRSIDSKAVKLLRRNVFTLKLQSNTNYKRINIYSIENQFWLAFNWKLLESTLLQVSMRTCEARMSVGTFLLWNSLCELSCKHKSSAKFLNLLRKHQSAADPILHSITLVDFFVLQFSIVFCLSVKSQCENICLQQWWKWLQTFYCHGFYYKIETEILLQLKWENLVKKQDSAKLSCKLRNVHQLSKKLTSTPGQALQLPIHIGENSYCQLQNNLLQEKFEEIGDENKTFWGHLNIIQRKSLANSTLGEFDFMI